MSAKELMAWLLDLMEQDMVDGDIRDVYLMSGHVATQFPPNDPRRKVFEAIAEIAIAIVRERSGRRYPRQSECSATWLNVLVDTAVRQGA